MVNVGKITTLILTTCFAISVTQGALAADRIMTVQSENGLTIITHKSLGTAEAQQETQEPKALFIPAVYSIDDAWNEQSYDFSENVSEPISSGDTDYSYETPVGLDQLAVAYGGGDHKSDGKEMIDRLMNRIPYKNTLKYTWDVVDGDVDLGVKNLRVDKGNKGVTYRTNYIPLVGEVAGTQIRADAGEDTKLTLTSDRLPFGERVEGLRFKASVGNDDSNISLRYKTKIDIDTRLDKTHAYQSAAQ